MKKPAIEKPARDLTMPNLLFLKLHTSGLYNFTLALEDTGQPFAIQVSAAVCNVAGSTLNIFSHIVKSASRMPKTEAMAIHGISAKAADQVGLPERRVMGILTEMLRTLPRRNMKVITFGDMDNMIVASLLSRFAVETGVSAKSYDDLWFTRPQTQFIDIQKPLCQQLCKLKHPFDSAVDEFKWPTLGEASEILLGRTLGEGRRDGLVDILAIRDLYFELKRRGYVEREEAAEAAE